MSERRGGLFRKVGDLGRGISNVFKGKIVLSSRGVMKGDIFTVRFDRGQIITRVFGTDHENFQSHEGFVVSDYENCVFLQQGSFVAIADSGFYELSNEAKTIGSELIWITKREFSFKYGASDIFTQDSISVGAHGVVNLRIQDPRNFITSVVAGGEEFKESDLERWVKTSLSGAVKTALAKYQVIELLRERKSIQNMVRVEIRTELARWGLEIVGLEVMGVRVPEKYRSVMELEARKAIKEAREILGEDEPAEVEWVGTEDENKVKEIQKIEQMLEKIDEKLLDGSISEERAAEMTKKYEDKIRQLKSQ